KRVSPRARFLLLGSLVSALLDASGARASCVAPGGAGGCFSSIQAAIDATSTAAGGARATIEGQPGTYFEKITVPGKSRLTLHGTGDPTQQVIDGSTAPPSDPPVAVVTLAEFADPGDLTLEDLSITSGGNGPGVFASGARVRFTLRRSRIYGSQSGLR